MVARSPWHSASVAQEAGVVATTGCEGLDLGVYCVASMQERM